MSVDGWVPWVSQRKHESIQRRALGDQIEAQIRSEFAVELAGPRAWEALPDMRRATERRIEEAAAAHSAGTILKFGWWPGVDGCPAMYG